MRYRRALIVALALAALLVSARAVFADDGPYNSNPSYCQHATPFDVPYYYWYECWLPPPPDWGQVPG